MNFLCPRCKKRVTKEEYLRRKLIKGSGIHDTGYRMEWVDQLDQEKLTLPVYERKWWTCSSQQPVAGERRILRVTEPFDENIGDEFTACFEPWNLLSNGWECAESPEEISKTCARRCRFAQVLRSDDFSAFIIVKVLKVVPLYRLYEVIPESVTEYRFFEEFGKEYGDDQAKYVNTEYEDRHWLYRDWSDPGGYLYRMQLIYTDDQGIHHEVVTSWSDMCHHNDNLYFFGNMVNKCAK